MGDARIHITTRMDGGLVESVDRFAEDRGMTRTAAIECLVVEGLKGFDSAEAVRAAVGSALSEAVSDLRDASARSERRIERELASVERAAKDASQIRADAAKAAQASLAHLAYAMFMANHEAAHRAGLELGPTSEEVAGLRVRDLYSGFWNVGGMLKRNPSPAWFQHAFKDLEANVPGCELERLVSVSREAWEAACEPPAKDSLQGGIKPRGMWG